MDSEMASNVAESHNYDTYTNKYSELSKSEAQGTVSFIPDSAGNEINLTLFRNSIPSQNPKIAHPNNIRRRITLKDFIFFLENERNVPINNILLHKAMIKMGQI
jgi:hypothetical protein